jgi:hypothetical protein
MRRRCGSFPNDPYEEMDAPDPGKPHFGDAAEIQKQTH